MINTYSVWILITDACRLDYYRQHWNCSNSYYVAIRPMNRSNNQQKKNTKLMSNVLRSSLREHPLIYAPRWRSAVCFILYKSVVVMVMLPFAYLFAHFIHWKLIIIGVSENNDHSWATIDLWLFHLKVYIGPNSIFLLGNELTEQICEKLYICTEVLKLITKNKPISEHANDECKYRPNQLDGLSKNVSVMLTEKC